MQNGKTRRIAKQNGSVIVYVVALTGFLIMVGLGLFLFCRLVGGERELRSANDAGCLNTAKFAPTIEAGIAASHQGSAPATAEYDNFHLLTSKKKGVEAVDLSNYNLLAGQALLVALNGQALEDYAGLNHGVAPYAATHRKWIIECLQGQKDSVANRLSVGLKQPNVEKFGDLARANSLRMLRSDGLKSQSVVGDVAYMDQGQASNLEVTDDIAQEIPKDMTTKVGDKRYLKGYFDYQAFGYTLPIAVSIAPNAQPHLVSQVKFEAERKLPPNITAVQVPPNAFRSQSSIAEELSGKKLKLAVASCSQIGTLNTHYLSIPFGYIEICNGYVDPLEPGTPMNGEYIFKRGSFSKQPNLGTIEAYDLGANTYLFSKQVGLLDKLMQFNLNKGPAPKPAEQQQIFYSNGNIANAEERGKVAQELDDHGHSTIFTCKPSDYQGTTRANLINLGASSKSNATDPGIQFNNLSAMENCVQQLLQHLPKDPVGGYVANVRPTGVRLYKQDLSYKAFPWFPTTDPATGTGLPDGQVSWNGTLPQLLDHVFRSNDGDSKNDNDKGEIELLYGTQGMYAKIHQIKPEATAEEIGKLLSSRALTNDGERYFILMEDPLGHAATSRQLVIRSSSELSNVPPIPRKFAPSGGPPGRFYYPDGDIENPDGGAACTTSWTYAHYFNSSIINVEGFNQTGEDFASMLAEDTASWTPGTGYDNFLGRLTFTARASGSVYNF